MPTDNRDDVLEAFQYHHWASDRVLGAVGSLTADQLDAKWGGSFATGRALVRHVVGVEHLWCDRWNGRSPKGLPEFPATHAGRDFLSEWKRIRSEQQDFLGRLTAGMLKGDLTYVNTKGEKGTYRLAEVLTHVVNHGTYHRGQITHLLRDNGLAAPSTDYLIFVDDRRKAS